MMLGTVPARAVCIQTALALLVAGVEVTSARIDPAREVNTPVSARPSPMATRPLDAWPAAMPEPCDAALGVGDTTDAVLREILAIRREQGGLLAGTLLHGFADSHGEWPGHQTAPGGWEEQTFARALQDVLRSRQSPPQDD